MYRDHTKVIKIGDRVIGGGNPILIQSMTNTKTSDIDATVAQILKLEKAGCDIIRSTVNDDAAAAAIPAIKKQIHIPLVADIHFDYRLAIASVCVPIDPVDPMIATCFIFVVIRKSSVGERTDELCS
jgi:(E)-4-hydroxy-3-methylbut-2-enyl-diphosphate synthase